MRKAVALSAASRRWSARYGPWAVVTGAAMGLGAEYARQIAARGVHVVLLDVRGDLAAENALAIAREFGVEARGVGVDLAIPDFMTGLSPALSGLEIGLLVNNAGVPGRVGAFLDVPLEDHLRAIGVNVRAPLVLTHALLPAMKARGRGGVVMMSSLSALVGTAMIANYAATKAYDLILAESLAQELRRDGVDLLAVLPGATDTPGYRGSNAAPSSRAVNVMPARATVAAALAALGHATTHVPGAQNRWSSHLLARVLPRRLAAAIVSRETRAMYARRADDAG